MVLILLKGLRVLQTIISRIPALGDRLIPGIERLILRCPAASRPWIWPFLFRQGWQFDLERAFHRAGAGRVSDPLFDAAVAPIRNKSGVPKEQSSGAYRVRIIAEGMLIHGSSRKAGKHRVAISVNGTIVRRTTLSGKGYFRIRILRLALLQFPADSRVELRIEDGAALTYRGGQGFRFTLPNGTGAIVALARKGTLINKKGGISQTPERIRARQDAYLEIYSEARKFFEAEFGKSLFLLYGTLLGVYRGGDFIPGDDDFDGGYVTDETDPAKIKEETKGMIVKLVQAGFTVSFNRRGKLFRLQKASGATDGMHLDLRPIWFDKDHMIAHKCAYIPAVRADFLPVRTTNLRGVEVDLPANPEAMLAGYYGPGWKVPDPSYVNDVSRVPSSIQRQLNQVYISPREYLEMTDYLRSPEGFRPGIGRFVSDGLQNLYPLEDFIEEEV